MIKKIALFGATGQTGNLVLEVALSKGYEVSVLVRDISKLKQKSDKLTIFSGDILNLEVVSNTINDADLVVSLFGHVKNSPECLQTNGTKNIIDAMKEHNVGRIISLSGGGLPFPEKDEPKFIDKLIRTIMKIVVPKVLNDAIAHHKVLEKSGLKWSIVRGSRLTNDPKIGTYTVGWVGVNSGTKISRADLADFIITQIEDETFNYQMPFVSN